MKALLSLLSLLCFFSPSLSYSQESFRRRPPYPDPLPALSLPDVVNHTLSNRLRLYLIHRPDLPLVNIHLTILTGEAASPDDRPGLATFTANMVSRGGEEFSASEVEETIDGIGGYFTTRTNPDYTEFSLSCLRENLDQALLLLSDMIVRPAFLRREIEELQRTTFYDLTRRRLDPEFSGQKLLYQLLFRDHAYQKIVYNESMIRTYSLSNIRSYYNNYYRPNNTILVITGDLSLDQASKSVSQNFNTWEGKTVGRLTYSSPKIGEAPQVCFLAVPRLKNVTIIMGALLPPKTSEDYFPLQVLNQVLGGTYISRLFMNLRESKSYAYGAYSQMEFYQNCGVFYVQAQVRPEVIKASVEEIQREIRLISTQRIPNEEIETAKSYLLGQFPLQIQTDAELSARIANIQSLGLSNDHWDRYYKRITLIDSQAVYDAARRNSLHTPIIIIVGDGSVLESIGFEKIDVYNHNGELIQSVTPKGDRK